MMKNDAKNAKNVNLIESLQQINIKDNEFVGIDWEYNLVSRDTNYTIKDVNINTENIVRGIDSEYFKEKEKLHVVKEKDIIDKKMKTAGDVLIGAPQS